MSEDMLAVINAGLSEIAVKNEYDIFADIGGQCYRATCRSASATKHLHIEHLATPPSGGSETSRTRLKVDSPATLQRLMGASMTKVMRLIASGDLKIEGDTTQLQDLQAELSPHEAALEALARQALAGGSGPGMVKWVPNDAASRCMNSSCGRRFGVFLRRHHCRACGGVFCKHCAPAKAIISPHTSRKERICPSCRSGAYSGGGRSSLGSQSDMSSKWRLNMSTSSGHNDHGDGSPRSSPLDEMDPALLILNWNVERQLRSLRTTSHLVLAAIIVGWGFVLFSARALIWGLVEQVLHLPLWGQGCLALFALALLWQRSLLIRLARVTWVVAVLMVSVLRTTQLAKGATTTGQNAIWEMAHRVHAKYILEAVAALSGFYVKVAQSLSVQPAIPEAFHNELCKLQDSMPADPHHEVEKTLAEEFGPNWNRKITLHPGPPLGSATIAQVHRATLRVAGSDGVEREVPGVIKVQHRQMQGNLTADMFGARIITHAFAILSPALFNDMVDIISDVAALTKNELDFRIEAENQRRAREAVLQANVDIVIPAVFDQLVTKRVMAMEFIDGCRLNDFAQGASHQEKTKAVRQLIEFFAFSFTQAGIFNCDPHPGNLLITAESKLVVLDWGQARRLTEHEMEAYCLLFVSAALEDPFLLKEVGETLGLKYSEKACVSMVPALRFLMRDSRPLQTSKEDITNLEKMFSGFADFKELSDVKGDASDVMRGPLLPLSKTVDLLSNVSTRLSVNLSLLQVFSSRGYDFLLRAAARPGVPLPSVRMAEVGFVLEPALPTTLAAAAPRSALEGRLRARLLEAHGKGDLLGAQMVVLDSRSGTVLCDLAIGHGTYLKGRPVTSETMFNLQEISKLVIAFHVMRLVERGSLRLDTKLGEVWPQAKLFKDISLEQVLSHTTGFMQVFPKDLKDMKSLCDLQGMLKLLEAGKLESSLPPGYKQSYQHFHWGWLLWAFLQGQRDFMKNVEADMAFNKESAAQRADRRYAGEADIATLTKPMNSSSAEEMAEMFSNIDLFLDILRKGRMPGASPEAKANTELLLGCHGQMYLLNPAAFDQPTLAEGLLPGVVGYNNAKSVATWLQRCERGDVVRPETLESMKRSRHVSGQAGTALPAELRQFCEADFGLGVELASLPGREKHDKAWGHTASGGSFALSIPGQRPLIAVLAVNRTDSWKRGVTSSILTALSEYAGPVQAQNAATH